MSATITLSNGLSKQSIVHTILTPLSAYTNNPLPLSSSMFSRALAVANRLSRPSTRVFARSTMPNRTRGVSQSLQKFRVAARRMFATATESSQPPKNAPEAKGLKALIKKYGTTALIVYLALGLIDLPICFAVVHTAGAEKISEFEDKVKEYIPFMKTKSQKEKEKEQERSERDSGITITPIEKSTEENTEGNQEKPTIEKRPSLFTELLIAYGIHKSLLIFIRVPIAASITPSVARLFRKWGFRFAQPKAPVLSTAAESAKMGKPGSAVADATASNPKFGSRPSQKQKWGGWFF